VPLAHPGRGVESVRVSRLNVKKNATFSHLTTLRHYLHRLAGSVACHALFPTPPRLIFRPEATHCCNCQVPLKVYKTHWREKVVTLHVGRFRAGETVLICEHCATLYRSEELARLVAPESNFGYDILVYVGKALFLEHCSDQTVVSQLAAQNIRISAAEVACLGRRFIAYLALAHRQVAGRLKQAMAAKGGYILHLDATAEGDSPLLMTGVDAVMDIVLANIKLSTENAKALVPFLREINTLFGPPLALVHDMSKGIINAVTTVFGTLPDFICHFHFLRDLGKDLFGQDYDTLRQRLRQHEIKASLRRRLRAFQPRLDDLPDLIDALGAPRPARPLADSVLEHLPVVAAYSLIQWALDGYHQGQGYGFPFDRPHLVFAHRLQTIHAQLDILRAIHLRHTWKDNKPFYRVLRDLKPVIGDHTLWRTVAALDAKARVFDRLRKAMRIAPVSGHQGLNHDGTPAHLRTIEQRVNRFRRQLIASHDYDTEPGYAPLIAQLDHYHAKLFADPIVVDGPTGTRQIQPQRTNNLMERLFRDLKRGHRRKTGTGSLSRALQTLLADTPLVRNLNNDDYMTTLLDGKPSLEALFADIEVTELRTTLKKAQQNPEKVPAKIKALIARPQYPEHLANIFTELSKG